MRSNRKSLLGNVEGFCISSSGRSLRLRWDFAVTLPMDGTFLASRQLEGEVNRLLGRALNNRMKSLAVRRSIEKGTITVGGKNVIC